jgi:hypothetical protein
MDALFSKKDDELSLGYGGVLTGTVTLNEEALLNAHLRSLTKDERAAAIADGLEILERLKAIHGRVTGLEPTVQRVADLAALMVAHAESIDAGTGAE